MQPDPVLLRPDLQAVFQRACAIHRDQRSGEPVPERAVFHLAVRKIGEGYFGTGKEKARHDAADIRLLLCIRLEKLEARGDVVKQIVHRNDRPLRTRRGQDFAEYAALAGKREGVRS